MTTWKRVTGDANDWLIVQCDGVDGFGAITSIVGLAWHDDTPDDVQEFAGEVFDAPNNLVKINLGTWLTTAEVHKYRYRTRITFTNGIVLSWPDGWPDTLEINR